MDNSLKYNRMNMNREYTFVPRPYTKTELALMYCPDSTPATALQCLYRWMRRCLPLMEELAAMGYDKYRHTLRRREVEAIVRHLGEP